MFNFLKKLYRNVKAASAGGFAAAIIMLSIGLYVAASILPGAVVDITNTTKWSGAPASVLTLVPIIGIIAVVAVILLVLRKVRGG